MKEILDSESLYIHSFRIGAIIVFDMLFNVVLENGETKTAVAPDPRHDIVIKIDITGNVNGFVIYSFGFNMVERITRLLVPDIAEDDIKNEYRDILSEVANMMTGNSLNVLSKSGLDMSPPAVMLRNELDEISAQTHKAVVFDQHSPFGELETTVVLNEA